MKPLPPEVISIGHTDFLVSVTKSIGSDKYGECDTGHAKVRLHPDQGLSSMRTTLIHELLHGLLAVVGAEQVHGLADADEEKLIRLLSPWIVGLLRDNPDLVSYLTK